jgi:hypothetical protein
LLSHTLGFYGNNTAKRAAKNTVFYAVLHYFLPTKALFEGDITTIFNHKKHYSLPTKALFITINSTISTQKSTLMSRYPCFISLKIHSQTI